MEKQIRHRRLHAFYTSKVLNAMMIIIIDGLLLMGYTGTMLPMLCSGVALAIFAAYACRLWFCNPRQIVINERLSDISGIFTLYFLIITALKATDRWWYIVPVILSVIILLFTIIKPADETFTISE